MSTTASRSVLTFRLPRRRYALPLDVASGARDTPPMRTVPGTAECWCGLAEWDGHVLNVLDLPLLLDDRVTAARSQGVLLRLRPPFGDLALWIPECPGLSEALPPARPRGPVSALDGGAETAYWIDLPALLRPLLRGTPR